MNKKERFALFLGMLCGDGCLSIKHNGEGYRVYPIQFCSGKQSEVELFAYLFKKIFGIEGRVSSRTREGRKEIWGFLKHSRKIFEYLRDFGCPEGKKKYTLKVPTSIFNSSKIEKKLFILGFAICDGYFNKSNGIMLHLGTKRFIEDLNLLISSIIGYKKEIKECKQNGKYSSYQLYLNKAEKELILSDMPRWDNGTPSVLRGFPK